MGHDETPSNKSGNREFDKVLESYLSRRHSTLKRS